MLDGVLRMSKRRVDCYTYLYRWSIKRSNCFLRIEYSLDRRWNLCKMVSWWIFTAVLILKRRCIVLANWLKTNMKKKKKDCNPSKRIRIKRIFRTSKIFFRICRFRMCRLPRKKTIFNLKKRSQWIRHRWNFKLLFHYYL